MAKKTDEFHLELIEQRTTKYFPHAAQCTIVGNKVIVTYYYLHTIKTSIVKLLKRMFLMVLLKLFFTCYKCHVCFEMSCDI